MQTAIKHVNSYNNTTGQQGTTMKL